MNGIVKTMEKEAIKTYFNQISANRLKWKNKNRYYYQELEKYVKFLIPEKSTVLEIGCGTGELLNAVKPSRGVGIDFSQEMIGIAKNKFPHLEFRIDDVEELKINERFDYVILSDIIGSLLDVQKAFEQLKKTCLPKTRIIITYYNYLWEPMLKLAEKLKLKMPQPLQNWLSLHDIENLLYLTDFEVIKKGYRLLLPKRIPLLSGFLNKFIANIPFFRKLCLTEIVVARPKPCNALYPNVNYTCSVVICCRNEKGNIRANIERIPSLGSHTEIIFVEGHSKDGTLEEIKDQIKQFSNKDIKVFVQDGMGKGDALRKGLACAQGDILMVLDADLTIAPEELLKFYDVLVQGKGEFIMGSRLVYPIQEEAMRLINLLGNKFFSIAFTYLLEQRIKDTLCANKVFLKSDYQKITMNRSFFGDFDPFGDFDLIFGAAKINLKILEIPIRYNARTYGATQINRFRHGWLLLKMCWIAFRKLKMM